MKSSIYTSRVIFLSIIIVLFSIISCDEDKIDDKNPIDNEEDKVLNLPETSFDYENLNLPSYFLTNSPGPLPSSVNGLDNTPSNNPITNDGATLGRVLFYDKALSKNGTVACASCHVQENSFSDPLVLSKGFEGGNTRRHSMTLINSRFYQRGHFFWDERAETLEDQVLMPFQDEVEMGLTLEELVSIVNSKEYYKDLFYNAFDSYEINSERISFALAQFVRSIVSYSSKYDIGRATANNMQMPFSNFTNQENEGKHLFIMPIPNGGGGCISCHTTEAFVSSNRGPENNGLDLTSVDDLGAYETFPNNQNLIGKFKTTTLRNIEYTAPYMHDGRFATLEEVVEHYNSGIQDHPQLSNNLRDPQGNPIRLNFTQSQKDALVAFLKTLSDPTIHQNEKWSNPFFEN